MPFVLPYIAKSTTCLGPTPTRDAISLIAVPLLAFRLFLFPATRCCSSRSSEPVAPLVGDVRGESSNSIQDGKDGAKGLGVQLQLLEAQTPSDLDNAFSAMARGVSMLSPFGPPDVFYPSEKDLGLCRNSASV
jgi:hypothetical protein